MNTRSVQFRQPGIRTKLHRKGAKLTATETLEGKTTTNLISESTQHVHGASARRRVPLCQLP